MRQRQEAARTARGRALEDYLATSEPTDRVEPDLIPDSAALTVAAREVRKLVRMAERTPQGPRRMKLLDELIGAMARLVFVERVMAKDELERAALTPAALVALSRVGREDLTALYDRMRGESGLEVAR
jgi:hypothetical protein